MSAARLPGPFPGLTPFKQEDAAFFSGREAECGVVVHNLLAYPVSVLFGPSGCGKSSLLHAGVLPALARREGPRNTVVVCSSWGDGPIAGLRAALLGAIGERSRGDEPPLAELVSAASARTEGRLLIVLDQFEEPLVTGGGPDEELARAIADAGPAAHVLIALRSEELGQLDLFDGEIPGLFDNLIELGHLDEAAGRAAIERPVAAWRAATGEPATVEPALVDEVLAAVGDDGPGGRTVSAPYLQLVLARLWEADRCDLTCAGLGRLGGVDAIVAEHVDRALADCSRREQSIAAAMFHVLVTPSRATLPQRAADLADYARVPQPEAARVLERLTVDARLLTPLAGTRYRLHYDALASPVLAWCERSARRAMRRRERRRLAGIMCFVAALLVLASLARALDPLELATIDARFALRGERPAPRDVLLVQIDDASLAKLDADWPVPRRLAGDAIDWIGEGRPKAIAYDVDFSGRRPDDVSLAEAIAGADRRVVVAASATAADGRVNVLGGDDVLDAIGARPGYSAFAADGGGVIRRPLYAADGVSSFAVAAVETAHGRPVPRERFDRAWLDYYGPEGTLRAVPFWKVASHAVPRRLFRDKIVVVGVTSPAIDRHPVWGLDNADMPGVEIQATAIDTIRRGLPLRSPPPVVSLVVIAACALLPALASRRLSPGATLALTLGAGALYAWAAVLAFDRGLVLPVVAPIAALLLAAFAVALVGFVAQRPPPTRWRR